MKAKPKPSVRKPRASDIKQEVGRNIRLAREIVAESLAQCARMLDVPENSWRNWEKGGRYPDPFYVVKFCNQFGLTADWIYRSRLNGIRKDVQLRLVAKLAQDYPEVLDADPDLGPVHHAMEAAQVAQRIPSVPPSVEGAAPAKTQTKRRPVAKADHA